MRRMVLNKKQQAEMKKITNFFLEATEPIEDIHVKSQVSVKIMSRLGCFADKLLQPCKSWEKWEEV